MALIIPSLIFEKYIMPNKTVHVNTWSVVHVNGQSIVFTSPVEYPSHAMAQAEPSPFPTAFIESTEEINLDERVALSELKKLETAVTDSILKLVEFAIENNLSTSIELENIDVTSGDPNYSTLTMLGKVFPDNDRFDNRWLSSSANC